MSREGRVLFSCSAHGLGHLAQFGAVVSSLSQLEPGLTLLFRGGHKPASVSERMPAISVIDSAFDDFGMVMANALDVDIEASIAAYEKLHRNWDERVQTLASEFSRAQLDLVVANIPYLPLAAARLAGIPSVALCSLNWVDILDAYVPHERSASWRQEMVDAYASAHLFLQPTPCMEMSWLENRRRIGPLCQPGARRRDELIASLGTPADACHVLVGFGGMGLDLQTGHWPTQVDGREIYYLLPAGQGRSERGIPLDNCCLGYSEVIASVDLVLTKPGYGMFVESACAGTPVLYVERNDWPDVPSLTSWLHSVANCREICREALVSGNFVDEMGELLRQGRSAPVEANGGEQAAALIVDLLSEAA